MKTKTEQNFILREITLKIIAEIEECLSKKKRCTVIFNSVEYSLYRRYGYIWAKSGDVYCEREKTIENILKNIKGEPITDVVEKKKKVKAETTKKSSSKKSTPKKATPKFEIIKNKRHYEYAKEEYQRNGGICPIYSQYDTVSSLENFIRADWGEFNEAEFFLNSELCEVYFSGFDESGDINRTNASFFAHYGLCDHNSDNPNTDTKTKEFKLKDNFSDADGIKVIREMVKWFLSQEIHPRHFKSAMADDYTTYCTDNKDVNIY